MKHQRNLLLVEDHTIPYQGLKTEFEERGWNIVRAIDAESTWYAFSQAREGNYSIDAVALDLALPPAKDNPAIVGLPLARQLRKHDEELPVLAYTSLSTQACDYSLLLARLLPLQISFISLRGDRDASPADFLELTWQGFVVLSPMIADFLPQAIAVKPDPLNEKHWETLKLLSEGRTQEEVARELPVGPDAVKSRLKRIGELLVKAGELDQSHIEQADQIDWYRRNHVRYCRQ
jgi:DNA-binding NarL/FixJ family response regulator